MSQKELVDHRKYLHKNPELSGEEKNTSSYIKKIVKKYVPNATITEVAEHGIIVSLKGKSKGKHVLLRCELDALPIEEVNTFGHRSKKKFVSHKCGHDGHMAILLAVAKHFGENGLTKGELSLLFQPAEENGEGAKAVIGDKHFKSKMKPDFVFALHNVPGYRKHKILCKENIFTPSVISIKVKLHGKTSHAAEPQNGINPSYAIAELLSKAKKLEDPNPSSRSYAIITPVYLNVGSEDHGIAAGYGEIDFTLRTWKSTGMKNLREKFMSLIIDISRKHDIKYELDWFQEFSSISNAKTAVAYIKRAAEESNLNYVKKKSPFPWGEDFGLFTNNIPGAMFGLGAGKKTPALHNPDYDFPDELIQTGQDMFVSIYNQIQFNV